MEMVHCFSYLAFHHLMMYQTFPSAFHWSSKNCLFSLIQTVSAILVSFLVFFLILKLRTPVHRLHPLFVHPKKCGLTQKSIPKLKKKHLTFIFFITGSYFNSITCSTLRSSSSSSSPVPVLSINGLFSAEICDEACECCISAEPVVTSRPKFFDASFNEFSDDWCCYNGQTSTWTSISNV